jgi:hypothetical protein
MLVCVFCHAHWHARPRVQRAPGLPCALYFFWGERFLQTSGAMCREKTEVCALSYPPLEGEGRRPPATRSVVRKRRGGVGRVGVETPRSITSPPHPVSHFASLNVSRPSPSREGEVKLMMPSLNFIRHCKERLRRSNSHEPPKQGMAGSGKRCPNLWIGGTVPRLVQYCPALPPFV